jgi:zinc transport system substrate-binding protein
MIKKFIGVIVALFFTVTVTGCSNKETVQTNSNSNKINVVTSFYGMKSLVEEIGKDKINIYNIVPEGAEPHDFEPKARDMEKIKEAHLFVLNGAGMESWSEKVIEALNISNLQVVDSSKGVELIKSKEHDNEEDLDEEEHEHGEYDPHTWLGIESSKIQGKNIMEALGKVDPSNKEFYEENYKSFEADMNDLLRTYKPKFNELVNKSFITGHATFGYLCKDLGLEQNSIEGIFSEGEPSPKKLEELVGYVKKNNVKVIFTESLASPEISETLAREVKGKTQVIYTLHSNEENKTFREVMKYNVETIYNSLQ